jgi:nucleotide-binding universal stress UspA family protein
MSDIIVAVNETSEAGAALRFAHRLAAARHHRVVALHARVNPSAEHTAAQEERYLSSMRDHLLAWLPPDDVAHTEVLTVDGDIADALIAAAGQRRAATVVVGSAPFEGATSYGLGSLVHHLARHLACPVVSVPVEGPEDAGDEVVVGIDGSEGSEVALLTAEDLALDVGGAVCAVYAVDGIYSTFSAHGYYGAQEQYARSEAGRQRSPVTFVERFGAHPSDVLADVARERRALLLVVSARQHHSLAGTLLGSVPDHLLHQPPCPVMVLPLAYVRRCEREAAGPRTG